MAWKASLRVSDIHNTIFRLITMFNAVNCFTSRALQTSILWLNVKKKKKKKKKLTRHNQFSDNKSNWFGHSLLVFNIDQLILLNTWNKQKQKTTCEQNKSNNQRPQNLKINKMSAPILNWPPIFFCYLINFFGSVNLTYTQQFTKEYLQEL